LFFDLSVDSIYVNPHNSRTKYSDASISTLARSLKENGQLVLIRVRPSEKYPGKYDLIYGHRRLLAAKKLGWNTIKAEIENVSEAQMAVQSLVENVQRENLSDYEKALFFQKLNTEFNLTYLQIGRIVGASKQSVANHLAMLRLFTIDEMNRCPDLKMCLQSITEHHARSLARVPDFESRADLVRKTVREKLSSRDLANIVNKLRSWFATPTLVETPTNEETSDCPSIGTNDCHEEESVKKVLIESYQLAKSGDFEAFKRTHALNMGYSLFSLLSSFELCEGENAINHEKMWFSLASKISWKLENIKINVFDSVAVATLKVVYSGLYIGSKALCTRGTVVLVKKDGNWKVFHEHYSQFPKKGQASLVISTTKLA
jgi:ParB family transcriptional regulator, chromosome partitioning protein